MKVRRSTLLLLSFTLLATLLIAPTASVAADNSASGLKEVGASPGDPRDAYDPGTCKSGDCGIPKCNTKTGGGSFEGNPSYYLAPFPLCNGFKWPRSSDPNSGSIVKCLVGYDEVRVYGTKSQPVKLATLSRVNMMNWCPPGQADVARLYWPNPRDSSGGIADRNTVWAVDTLKNVHQEQVTLSDNCTRAIALGGTTSCSTSSRAVRYAVDGSGKSTSTGCEILKVTGENSIGSRLSSSSTSSEMRSLISSALWKHYLVASSNASRYKSAFAASLTGQPVNGLTAATLSGPSSIKSFAPSQECATPLDFIPALRDSKSATNDPVVLGSCVMPIFLPARLFIDYTQPETLPNGTANPKRRAYGFWGTWNENYVPRYDNIKVRVVDAGSVYDPSVGTSLDAGSGSTIGSAYERAVRALITKDPGTPNPDTGEMTKVGAYFYPKEIGISNGPEVLLTGNVGKQAKETRLSASLRADSAVDAASCWATQLASFLVDCDPEDKRCATTPTPTPTPTPKPTSSSGATAGDPITDGGQAGPVSVTVTVDAPASYTVGGLSRLHTTRVTDVAIRCSGRVCGSSPSDPDIDSTPTGSLILQPASGYTACSSSKQTKCGQLITRASGTGVMESRSVESVYYTPTRSSEKVRIGLGNMSLRITPKRYVPGTCTNPPIDPKSKITPVPCTPPPGVWVRDTANSYTITSFSIRFSDGKGAYRSVTGTIGK